MAAAVNFPLIWEICSCLWDDYENHVRSTYIVIVFFGSYRSFKETDIKIYSMFVSNACTFWHKMYSDFIALFIRVTVVIICRQSAAVARQILTRTATKADTTKRKIHWRPIFSSNVSRILQSFSSHRCKDWWGIYGYTKVTHEESLCGIFTMCEGDLVGGWLAESPRHCLPFLYRVWARVIFSHVCAEKEKAMLSRADDST